MYIRPIIRSLREKDTGNAVTIRFSIGMVNRIYLHRHITAREIRWQSDAVPCYQWEFSETEVRRRTGS
jgi:hypothetical protein